MDSPSLSGLTPRPCAILMQGRANNFLSPLRHIHGSNEWFQPTLEIRSGRELPSRHSQTHRRYEWFRSLSGRGKRLGAPDLILFAYPTGLNRFLPDTSLEGIFPLVCLRSPLYELASRRND